MMFAAFVSTTCSLLAGCGASTLQSVAGPASAPVTTPAAVKTGPQLGYLWNSKDHTLNAVLGIPGSSQIGESVVPANLYIGGTASANSSLALLQESDGSFDLMSLPTGTPARLAANLGAGAQVRFAPSGFSAVAFVPGASSVTVFSNLASTAQVKSVAFSGAISEAAISDGGSVAGALQQAGSVVVRTVSTSGAANSAGVVASFGGLSFSGTTEDLLVADATANTLTVVRNSTSSPAPSLLSSGGLLHGPAGVQASHDGHWAVLANSGDTNLVRIDLTSRTSPQSYACTCQPTLVAPLSGAGVFRVTGLDDGPAWMIDAAASTPRVLFIPASMPAGKDSTVEKAGLN